MLPIDFVIIMYSEWLAGSGIELCCCLLKWEMRKFRKEAVTRDFSVEHRENDAVGLFDGLGEYLLSSYDENLAVFFRTPVKGLFERGDSYDSGSLQGGVAADDDIYSLIERFFETVKGFTAHNDGKTCGCLLEKQELFGDMPGNTVVFANDPVFCHRSDDDNFHGIL